VVLLHTSQFLLSRIDHDRQDADSAPTRAVVFEAHATVNLREERVVFAEPDVQSGREPSAALPYELDAAQHLFLFSRADTIYGGSDEIQRTIIAERALGLPKEPRGRP